MVEDLIWAGESDIVEFKASMKTSMQDDAAIISIKRALEKAEDQEKNRLQNALEEAKKTLEKSLEHEIIKTVARIYEF